MFNLFKRDSKTSSSPISFTTESNRDINKKDKHFGWKKIFSFSDINEDFYSELEENLILSDVGGRNAMGILKSLRSKIETRKIRDQETSKEILKTILKDFFVEKPLSFSKDKLNVVMVIGINGVGKTTTIAKLGYLLKKDSEITIGAADTFRAAAVDQLKEWGRQIGSSVISQDTGGDPASVVYDTIHSALAKNKNIALIDTAGRLHNKDNLLAQLEKIVKVSDKFSEKVNRVVLLVLDATQGLSGFEQVKSFEERIPIDGLILTKCDTQAKGGILLSISEQFKVPVHYYTYGEKLEDIASFSVDAYLNSLI